MNICCPKCHRHRYLLPKMSVTFLLSILSGNRLPLCLPRSWQPAQLFCSASLIFCVLTLRFFAFGFSSLFGNNILEFCATQLHFFCHWRHLYFSFFHGPVQRLCPSVFLEIKIWYLVFDIGDICNSPFRGTMIFASSVYSG